MTGLPPGCPERPDWRFDWDALDVRYPWIRAMKGVPQNPQYHAEGDVWIHTRMVVEALVALDGWRALEPDRREALFWAALLHDVAKPAVTKLDEHGQASARGHAGRGEVLARQLLWREGVELATRERICQMIREHLTPFFLIEGEKDAARIVHALSQRCVLRELALLAEADARGRVCADQDRLLDAVALFRELARDEGCYDAPFAFPSDLARFEYFRRPTRSPYHRPHEPDDQPTVVYVCGLPAAGKDHWVEANLPDWPRVHLDALRRELGVDPAGDQGALVAAARERARELLRRGESFVWNATGVSRQQRAPSIGLFADYGAQVRLVHLETDEATLHARNRARPRPVPDAVMARLLDRWQVPDRTEACQVEWLQT